MIFWLKGRLSALFRVLLMNRPTQNSFTRRHVLSASAATLVGGLAVQGRQAQAQSKSPSLKKGDVILFQGDSITDARRDKKRQGSPNDAAALGLGYPLLLGSQLLADHPELDLKIYNRGISGHKVPQLDARWQEDCLDLKPAILSILVGVNDMWHKLNGKYDGTVADYGDQFAALIQRTRKALPKVRIVVCDPFVLKCGAINDKWFPEFTERRALAKKVADDAATDFVPFQSMFDQAVAAGTEPAYWARDGVHPTPAGHALMAKTWRKVGGV